ncbi:MAG: hypothetical protein A2020_03650 [Lentisphaerae bacterium GWF2_45_14]|nr:MAG: hypothetical protein A2020_03650 [Lentisphaerae bacterium GWF2_45_14]
MIESRRLKNISASRPLEDDLRRMILRNELQEGSAITPEMELAKRYNISRNTARKALANLENEGLLRKVQGRGTFVVPPDERPAGSPLKHKIILAVNDYSDMLTSNAYDRNLISGCLEYAFHANMELLVADPSSFSYESLSNDFDSGRLNGIIWERPIKEIFPLIEELRDKKLPQVAISRSIPGVPSLFFDADRSIRETVEFLNDIGHHDIAFVDLKSDYSIFVNRQRAFADALRRMGHKYPEKYICLPPFGSKYEDELDKLPPVTAIISASFVMDGIYSWLERKGLRVPGDISLISLSSENSRELLSYPELSAILDPRQEIGLTAMEILDDIIAGRQVSSAPIRIRGELLIRKSCVSPLINKEKVAI